MPYADADDATLPDRVKKMPKAARDKFVGVFNSSHKNCQDSSKGGGAGAECEGTAMKFANAAVKELGFCDNCGEVVHKVGEKCSGEVDKPMSEAMEMSPPLGGSTSFSEAEVWEKSQKLNDNVFTQRYKFDQIIRNIWEDDDKSLADKTSSVAQAAQDLADRIAAGPTASKSLPEKVKDFFMGSKSEEDGPTLEQVSRAIADMQPVGFRDSAKGPVSELMLSRLGSSIDNLSGASEGQKARLRERLAAAKSFGEADPGNMVVTKDASGAYRWVAVFTNKYKDREGQIFCEEAHKEYEAWVDRTQQYPELRLWHVPGSRIGKADFVAYDNGFQIASGTFDDSSMATRLAGKEFGLSHGYRYADEDLTEEGVFERYRTFELSLLPRPRASNPYHLFTMDAIKEVDMALTPQKREFLKEHLGEERTAAIESNISSMSKELEQAGIAWKEILEEEPAATAVADGPNPTPTPDPDPDPTPNPPDPDPTAGDPVDATSQALLDQIRKIVNDAVEPVATDLAGLKESVKELEQTDDEKIAAALAGRGPRVANGQRPSEGDSTLVPDQARAKELTQEGDEGSSPVAPYVAQLMGRGA